MAKYPKVSNLAKADGSITRRRDFESLTAICDLAVAKGQGVTAEGARRADSMASTAGTWANHMTAEETTRLLDNAQQHLIAAVEEIRERIEKIIDVPTVKSRKRKYRLEAGDEISAIDFIQRNTEGWSDIVRTKKPKRTIKIGINVVTACFRKPHELLHRGAAVVALADILASLGHGVEIHAFWSATWTQLAHCRDRELLAVTIKGSDAPMNINSTVVALAEIAFSRTVMMPAIARSCESAPSGGMGYVSPMSAEDRAQFDVLFDEECLSLDAAVEVVRRSIAKAEEAK